MVTGEDVAADHAFQQAIAAIEMPALLLATVNREGRFRMMSCGVRHRKVLCEARLDLDRLLASAQSLRYPAVGRRGVALPAVLQQRPFPLLLSHSPVELGRAWAAPLWRRPLNRP